MKVGGRFFGEGIALALDRADVYKGGALHALGHFKAILKGFDVVAVNRPHVCEAHILEDCTVVKKIFYSFFYPSDDLGHGLSDKRNIAERLFDLGF